jgi:murein DD-endopeptidase MepM/ murein hydrolase activator NlpD
VGNKNHESVVKKMIVRVTSKFGEVSTIHPAGHKGVDIALKEGTPIKSVMNGVVEKVVHLKDNIGEGVIIKFENGTTGIYGHLSKISVEEGETLRAGEILGYSGSSGRSTGPHLHFGLKENGEFIDPSGVVQKTVEHDGILTSIGKWFAERGAPGTYEHADYNLWGDIGEKILHGVVQGWLPNFMVALPFLFIVSMGMWGLLSMVNKTLATWGVGFVMVMGGIVII